MDLGEWAAGGYAIPAEFADGDGEAEGFEASQGHSQSHH